MNWTLIRKDLRLMRPVTIGAIILAVVFYITLPGAAAYEMFRMFREPPYTDWTFWMKLYQSRFNLSAAVSTACMVANGCLLLWGAVLGGIAFALERRERWGDLLGTLPLTREQWIGTKFTSSLIWAVGYVLVNVMLYAVNAAVRAAWSIDYWNTYRVGGLSRWDGVPVKDFVEGTLSISSYALALFGMAWLVSAIIRSAAIAASIPIGVVLVTFVMAAVLFEGSPLKGLPSELQEAIMEFVLPLVVAAVTIPTGIAIQRMRATP